MELEKNKAVIEQLLALMKIEAEVSISEDPSTHFIVFAINAKEPSLLIGYKGETLMALSHVLKKMLDPKQQQKEREERKKEAPFIVDVNGYQQKRINNIKDKATILVERARYYKSSVEMDPMSSYERMIVHSLFAADPQIKTESTGIGRERRVIIEYIGDQ